MRNPSQGKNVFSLPWRDGVRGRGNKIKNQKLKIKMTDKNAKMLLSSKSEQT